MEGKINKEVLDMIEELQDEGIIVKEENVNEFIQRVRSAADHSKEEKEDDRKDPVMMLTDAGDSPEEYHGYCPNCGTELGDEDNFCSECGQHIKWDNPDVQKILGRSRASLEQFAKDNKYKQFVNELNQIIISIIELSNKYAEDVPNLKDFDHMYIDIDKARENDVTPVTYNAEIYASDGECTSIDMNLRSGNGGMVVEKSFKNQSYKSIKGTDSINYETVFPELYGHTYTTKNEEE